MIAYFDTSALIPLLVDEPGSRAARQVWSQAQRAVSVRLVYAQARAALAQAQRLGRVSSRELRLLVERLENIYDRLDRIEVDEPLVRSAGEFAEGHALRGYDAIHLAGAKRVADQQTVFVSGDHNLSLAARRSGLSVTDLSIHP